MGSTEMCQKCETVVIKWVRAQPTSSGAAGKQFGRSGKAVRDAAGKSSGAAGMQFWHRKNGFGRHGRAASGRRAAGAQRDGSGTAASVKKMGSTEMSQKCKTVVKKWVRAQPKSSGAAGAQRARQLRGSGGAAAKQRDGSGTAAGRQRDGSGRAAAGPPCGDSREDL